MIKKCLTCKKEYHIKRCASDISKYCSSKCKQLAWRRGENRVCPVCRKQFYLPQSVSSKRITCSKECFSKYVKANPKPKNKDRWVKNECLVCGREYLVIPCRKYRAKTCSLICKGKYQSKQNNPNWKGGITPERQSVYVSKKWKGVVLDVWKKYSARCFLCNLKRDHQSSVEFHIHHIESFRNKEMRMNLLNLVLLCEDCHSFIHSKLNIKRYLIK